MNHLRALRARVVVADCLFACATLAPSVTSCRSSGEAVSTGHARDVAGAQSCVGPADTAGLHLPLMGDVSGLRPWPEWHGVLAGVRTSSRVQTVSVMLPHERTVSSISYFTAVCQYGGKVDAISLRPHGQSMSLQRIAAALHDVLKSWAVIPSSDVSQLIEELNYALHRQGSYPATDFRGYGPVTSPDGRIYWGGDQAEVDLAPLVQCHIAIYPDVSASVYDKYNLVLEIHAADAWYPELNPAKSGFCQVGSGWANADQDLHAAPLLSIHFERGRDQSDLRRDLTGLSARKLGNTYDVQRAGMCYIWLPGEGKLAIWSSQAQVSVSESGLNYITIRPANKMLSLSDSLDLIRFVFDKWKMKPRGGVRRVVQNLSRAVPRQGQWFASDPAERDPSEVTTFGKAGPTRSYWSFEMGDMLVTPTVQLFVEVRPSLSEVDRYATTLTFSFKRPGTWE